MTEKKPLQQITFEVFNQLSDEEKLRAFVSLQKEEQKFLIGLAIFASPALPVIAIPVTELDLAQFEQVKSALKSRGFVTLIYDENAQQERIDIPQDMKHFVNVTLMKAWEEQQKRNQT